MFEFELLNPAPTCQAPPVPYVTLTLVFTPVSIGLAHEPAAYVYSVQVLPLIVATIRLHCPVLPTDATTEQVLLFVSMQASPLVLSIKRKPLPLWSSVLPS